MSAEKKDKNQPFLDDEEVEKMVKTWDKVKCKKCGKTISMLNSVSIPTGWVCKGGCKNA
jgi:hypothetical protein